MKICALQIMATTTVMPISGWASRKATTVSIRRVAITVPGMVSDCCPAASIQATTTANSGLRISEGCSVKPAMNSQRLAPLISGAISAVRISRNSETPKPITANRRTPRGDSRETPNMMATPSGTKTIWRVTKWNVSALMRSAAGGPAARISTIPMATSRMTVASMM